MHWTLPRACLAMLLITLAGCGDSTTSGRQDVGWGDTFTNDGQGGGDGAVSGLQAELTAQPNRGPAPLAVTFAVQATGGEGELTYLWDPGDGSDPAQGPALGWTHTYTAPGEYTVTVTVTDGFGSTVMASTTVMVGRQGLLTVTVDGQPLQGAVPLDVSLTASAQGGTEPYTYLWDLGDGDAAEGADVAHQYLTPGIHDVVVTVMDSLGNQGQASLSVEALAGGLTVALEADPLLGPAPLNVTFTATPTGGEAPLTLSWDMGDGSTDVGRTVEHTYQNPGSYVVIITVTDAVGDMVTAQVTVEALGDEPLSATITAEPPQGQAPLEVELTGAATGGAAPYGMFWDLGDGSTAMGEAITHIYGEAGEYVVTLTVTDALGAEAQAVATIIVEALSAFTVSLTAEPDRGQAPLTVAFMAEAQGGEGEVTFAWDLGDGTTAEGSLVEHTYHEAGTYTVVVTATDGAGSEALAETVVVASLGQDPEVTVTADPDHGVAPLSVTLTATATGGDGELTFTWDLGDGTMADGAVVEHTYATAGAYTATAIVTDGDGSLGMDSVTIVVVPPLAVQASAEPNNAIAPAIVRFTGVVQGGVTPLRYRWDFGDGVTGTQLSPEHLYLYHGTYEATLTVTDDQGHQAGAVVTVTLEEDLSPLVSARAQPMTGMAPLLVDLMAEASGGNGALTVTWDLGDGQRAEGVEVEHLFVQADRYEVMVTVTDEDGDTAVDTLLIAALPDTQPQVEAQAYPDTGLAPLTVAFGAMVTGGNGPFTYAWNFGDGSLVSLERSPVHEYRRPGMYMAQVTVTDVNGDEGSDEVAIAVGDGDMPVAMASANPTEGLAPLTVQFYGQGLGGSPPLEFTWDFGDGSPPSREPNPTHIYTGSGTYTAVLAVRDRNGHTASDSVIIQVGDDQLPVLTITAEPDEGAPPLDVAFQATVRGGNEPYVFEWDLGDGFTEDRAAFTHIYDTPGNYLVACMVRDFDGDEDHRELEIRVSQSSDPTAHASGAPLAGLAPLFVQFQGSATGGDGPISYFWDFGDGFTAQEQNPSHMYHGPGIFTVTLVVTDGDGGFDEDTLTVEVASDQVPLASAQANPTAGLAPLTVQFTGSAQGGNQPLTYRWDFGDGMSAQGTVVSHTYMWSETFLATLTVQDANGDVDTVVLTIKVASDDTPVAVASAEPERGLAPLNVAFTGEAVGGNAPLTYTWTFGDGTTGQGAALNHVYGAPGTYTARLTVTDGDGDNSQDSIIIEVLPDSHPVITVVAEPAQGLAPLYVSFTATVQGGEEPYLFFWSFGDGVQAQGGGEMDHTYSREGTFEAMVTVEDGSGDMASAMVTIEVGPVTGMRVNLYVSPTTGRPPLRVEATAEVEGGEGPYEYFWDFSDGSTAYGPDPWVTHEYRREGEYLLSVTVTDASGQEAGDSQRISVGDIPPQADLVVEDVWFMPNPEGLALFQAVVINQGDGPAGEFFLAFYIDQEEPPGPNSMPTGEVRIDHLPPFGVFLVEWVWDNPEEGHHMVWARADSHDEVVERDEGNNIFGPLWFEVIATGLWVNLDAWPTQGPAPLDVEAVADVGDGFPPYTYQWDFGDGSGETGFDPWTTHTYRREGEYTLTLTVLDSQGNSGSDSVRITVGLVSPEPDLVIQEAWTEMGPDGDMSLFAMVVNQGDGPAEPSALGIYIDQEEPPWPGQRPFGEAQVERLPPGGVMVAQWPCHDMEPGWHMAWVVADWSNMVRERDEYNNLFGPMEIEIPGSGLTVNLWAEPTAGRPPLRVSAWAEVSGGSQPYSYTWDFGDGQVQVGGANTTHVYQREGEYRMTLTVTDGRGNRASDSVVISVGNVMQPDLVIQGMWTEPGEPEGVYIGVDVANRGNGSADASRVGLYVDGEPDPNREPTFDILMDGLWSGDMVSVGQFVMLPPGRHLVWAMADWRYQVAESDEGNNLFGPIEFEVPGSGLTVNLSVEPTSGRPPLRVSARAEVWGGTPPYSYTWDFGNGMAASGGATTTYTYQREGQYLMTVTVTDRVGNRASDSEWITVGDVERLPDLEVRWLEVEGGGSEGTYLMVSVSNRGQAMAMESLLAIFIDPRGEPGPWMDPNELMDIPPLEQGQEMIFEMMVGNIAPGDHMAYAMADWAQFVQESNEDNVYGPVPFEVGGAGLRVDLTASPSSGAPPLAVEANAAASGGWPPYNYTWDFGDGWRIFTLNPRASHTYRREGDYTISVTVTDSRGSSASDTVSVRVMEAAMDCQVPMDCLDLEWVVDCMGYWSCSADGRCGEVCDSRRCGDRFCDPRGGESSQSCPLDC